MKPLTKRQLKKLKQRNAAFRAMPKWKQRVAIAKDALKQIAAGKYRVKTGMWASMPNLKLDDENKFGQEEILQQNVTCTGCALGGALVSSLRLANAYRVLMFVDTLDVRKQLSKFFTPLQMAEIETAFELGSGAFGGSLEAQRFGSGYDSQQDRAIAIFTNIVKNKGTFKP